MSVPALPGTAEGPLLDAETTAGLFRLVSSVRFGSVEIVIHDGPIVDIKRREKVRLDKEL
jgi:hypothetical protein